MYCTCILQNFKSSIFTCFHANAYFKDIIIIKNLKANLKDTKNILCVEGGALFEEGPGVFVCA
jgi:hypothetical protein